MLYQCIESIRSNHNLLKRIVACGLIFIAVSGLFSFSAHAYEVNKNAIVLLAAKDGNNRTFSTGTGFIVDPDGTLVTNYHVLVDAVSMEAIFRDGSTVAVEGIKKVDRSKDFAILKLKGDIYSTLEIGDSDSLKTYDYTSALGYLTENVQMVQGQLKGNIVQTYGFVLGVHYQANPDFTYIYTTSQFGPGFSGGPLVNNHNQVVGLATVEGRAINLALPINYIKPYVKDSSRFSFQTLLEQDKNAKETFYYKGNFALYNQGDPQKAIDYFNKALDKDPNYVLAHYDLAVAHRNQGDIPLAIEKYEEVIKINPKFPEGLSNLGGHYFREGRYEEAVRSFKSAIEHYPNFIQALSNLGAALVKTEKGQEAIPYLKQAISLSPEFGMAHFNLGNAYFSDKQYPLAEKSFMKAIELGVDYLSLHWKLYEIYHSNGETSKAKKQLDIILKLDPEDLKARQKREELLAVPRK